MTDNLLKKIWFIFIALALLIPRELNFRPWRLSFSITDVVFVLLVLIWVLLVIKCEIDLKGYQKINLVLLSSILLIVSLGAMDWFLKGMGNKHVFFKDLYTFLIAPIIFLIVFNISKPNLLNFVLLIFISNTLLSLISIMIVELEPLSNWYIEATGGFLKSLSERMGYIITVDNTMTDVLTLRTNFLIGGAGNPGMLALLGLPLYLAFFKHIQKKFGLFLPSISIILIMLSSLNLMSITIFISLVTVIVTWLIFSQVSKKEKTMFFTLVLITFLLFGLTGKGEYLLKRLGKVEHFIKSKLIVSRIEKATEQLPPTSTEVRGKLYSHALKLISKDPLLGIGMGNHFEGTVSKGNFVEHYRIDRVENLYLTLLLKLGLVGFIFIFFFVFFCYKIYVYLKTNFSIHKSDEYLFVMGVLFGIFGLLVAGLFEYIFYSLSFNMLIWSSIAICAKIIGNRDAYYN